MNTSAHLCLVSAQPTPNLTPVLDPAVAPRKVFLLVSPDMTQRADWLEAVIRPRGIVVERWPVDNPWAIDAIRDSVLNLLAAQSDLVDRREIALNATGGTKPMSIAAYDAFRTLDLPIFYVHPEQDCMIWMHPGISSRGHWPTVSAWRTSCARTVHRSRRRYREISATREPSRSGTAWWRR